MKLKCLITLILLISVISNCFAQIEKELKTEEDGYQWYLIKKEGVSGYFGAQDINGKEIIPLSIKYEWISYENVFLVGTIFETNGNQRRGYYDKNGNEIISHNKYDSAYYQESSNGTPPYFFVYKNGKEGACDITGKEIVEPIYESLLYNENGFEAKIGDRYEAINIYLPGHDIMSFVEKTKIVESDNFTWYKLDLYPYYGVADNNGNIIIPLDKKFTRIKYNSSLQHNGTGIFEIKKEDYIGLYNSQGKEILSPDKEYTSYKYKNNNYLIVEKGELEYGICDLNQNEIIAPGKYSYVRYNNEGFFEVERNDYEGICDLNGKEIISPDKYTSISHISFRDEPQWFCVKQGELEGACDMSGKEIVPVKYSSLHYSNETGFYHEDDFGNEIALNIKIEEYNTIPENTEYIKSLFEQAYNTPDSEAQTKYDLYMQVIEADKGNTYGYQAIAYNNIGALYEYLEDLENAKHYYSLSCQVQPNYELAQNNLKRVKKTIRTEKWNNFANTLSEVSQNLQTINNKYNNSYNNQYQNNYNQEYSNTQTIKKSQSTRQCTHCAGSGECKKCRGNGRILGKFDQEYRPCPLCGHKPKAEIGKCTHCKGTGRK